MDLLSGLMLGGSILSGLMGGSEAGGATPAQAMPPQAGPLTEEGKRFMALGLGGGEQNYPQIWQGFQNLLNTQPINVGLTNERGGQEFSMGVLPRQNMNALLQALLGYTQATQGPLGEAGALERARYGGGGMAQAQSGPTAAISPLLGYLTGQNMIGKSYTNDPANLGQNSQYWWMP